MIQVRYTDRALYLYFVAFSGYFTLTLGLGFVLLWEPNAAADLIGGGTQAIMWVMESGCKYRGSLTHLPATHLLLYGPVPNRSQTSTSVWSRGWGPLIYMIIVLMRRGTRDHTLSAPPLHRHRPNHVRAVSRQPPTRQKSALTRKDPAGILILDFQPPNYEKWMSV